MSLQDEIHEIASGLSQDNLPVFYKYRYTYPEGMSLTDQIDIAGRLVDYIRKHYMLGAKFTLGIEHYTKGMMVAKPHVHIHFQSKTPSKTIRDSMAKAFGMRGKCQSCKAEVLVDEDKFWRYPLKQQKSETERHWSGGVFTPADLDKMREVAYACWKQAAQVLLHQKERKEERTSRDRLYNYLDEMHSRVPMTSLEKTRMHAYMYYAEHEDMLNVSTVDGYVNVWLLKNRVIGITEFYRLTH